MKTCLVRMNCDALRSPYAYGRTILQSDVVVCTQRQTAHWVFIYALLVEYTITHSSMQASQSQIWGSCRDALPFIGNPPHTPTSISLCANS